MACLSTRHVRGSYLTFFTTRKCTASQDLIILQAIEGGGEKPPVYMVRTGSHGASRTLDGSRRSLGRARQTTDSQLAQAQYSFQSRSSRVTRLQSEDGPRSRHSCEPQSWQLIQVIATNTACIYACLTTGSPPYAAQTLSQRIGLVRRK